MSFKLKVATKEDYDEMYAKQAQAQAEQNKGEIDPHTHRPCATKQDYIERWDIISIMHKIDENVQKLLVENQNLRADNQQICEDIQSMRTSLHRAITRLI